MVTNQDKYGRVADWTKTNGQSDLRRFVDNAIVKSLFGEYSTVVNKAIKKISIPFG